MLNSQENFSFASYETVALYTKLSSRINATVAIDNTHKHLRQMLYNENFFILPPDNKPKADNKIIHISISHINGDVNILLL